MRRLGTALALLASVPAAAQWEYLPPSPQAGEMFAIVGALRAGVTGGCPVKTMQARIQGDEIKVDDYTGPGSAGPSWSCRLGSLVPGLPAGRYFATLRTATGPLGEAGVVTVTAGAAMVPQRRDLSGNWFNPTEDGWGLNIVQGDSGKLFVAWMMYRPARDPISPAYHLGYATIPGLGNSLWLAVPDGRWITPTTWRGLAYHTRSVGWLEPDDATKLQVTPVGYVEIAFTGTNEAVFRGRFINESAPEPMVEKNTVLRRLDF
jgi:hypothetical protein